MRRPLFDEPEPGGDDTEMEEDVIYVGDEPGAMRRAGAVISFLMLFLLVVTGLGGYWVYSQVNPTPSDELVTVVIPNDSGMATIARLLEEEGIITNATVFQYYARIKGIGPVRAGEYDQLRRGEPMDRVIERLEEGPAPLRYTDLPIPEGLWLTETVTRIKDRFPQMDDAELAAALTQVRSAHQPEGEHPHGFLFPATYRVTEQDYDDEVALIEQMVRKFDEVADDVGLAEGPERLVAAAGTTLTPYEVLIVASLIEAEAKVPEDRPRIARVIYNRMKADMRLDIDAAVYVAIGERKAPLTTSDLQTDSPYNLRRYPGLTPTPINSPGEDSLRAALEPSTEPGADRWLYYVLIDEDGHHSFSETRDEHDRKAAQAAKDGLL
jgi:UPF0755 protein